MKSITLSEKDIARFWSKVKIGNPDECWEWQGSLDMKGYGHFQIQTPNPLGRESPRSHRVSYYIKNGDIPIGMLVCHKCDNPACVNPSHLFLGTADDNNKDRARKGRSAKGSQIHTSLLSEDKVFEIMKYKDSGKSQRQIAKIFGVSHVAIGNIFRGATWRHLNNTEVQND